MPPEFDGVGVGTGAPLDPATVTVGLGAACVGAALVGEGEVESVGVAAAVADRVADVDADVDAEADAVGLPALVAAAYLTMGLFVPSAAMMPAWLVRGSL